MFVPRTVSEIRKDGSFFSKSPKLVYATPTPHHPPTTSHAESVPVAAHGKDAHLHNTLIATFNHKQPIDPVYRLVLGHNQTADIALKLDQRFERKYFSGSMQHPQIIVSTLDCTDFWPVVSLLGDSVFNVLRPPGYCKSRVINSPVLLRVMSAIISPPFIYLSTASGLAG